ncbi:hypothetical protein BR1R3_37140 [Pseudomonas atacamensis]|nr:hypothetical protein BR1R3_37140 [Pseudomonas atacamensis]
MPVTEKDRDILARTIWGRPAAKELPARLPWPGRSAIVCSMERKSLSGDEPDRLDNNPGVQYSQMEVSNECIHQ